MKTISLTQGKFAKVDNEDFDFINQWGWYYANGYAIRKTVKNEHLDGKKQTIWMHRLINKTPEGFDTEHEDGDKLNNQKYNLRTATHKQNIFNKKPHKNTSSKYKGVSWYRIYKKWRVQIKVNGKVKHLGYLDNEIKAAKEYDTAALKYFGEFAYVNFPQEVSV